MRTARPLALSGLLLAAASLLPACSSTYYGVMESFGYEKRDILKDRVAESKEDQKDAKQQFRSTLEAFKAATGFTGGDLESVYNKLSSELKQCEVRAEEVRNGIDEIQDVALDLFDEWKREAARFSDPKLREQSKTMLASTRARYDQVMLALRRSEKTMDPVLAGFSDQVLFLKHNLNAAAISSLSGNVMAIEADVDLLIKDMEAAIAEADAFIKTLGEPAA